MLWVGPSARGIHSATRTETACQKAGASDVEAQSLEMFYRCYVGKEGITADDLTKWRRQGEVAAERDIKAGKMKVKFFGRPDSWRGANEKLLRDRLGIETEVHGCVGTVEEFCSGDWYNLKIGQEIVQRFGADIFDQLEELARQSQTKAVR
jgi:hypothetical protein